MHGFSGLIVEGPLSPIRKPGFRGRVSMTYGIFISHPRRIGFGINRRFCSQGQGVLPQFGDC